jgi:hypothetical protein
MKPVPPVTKTRALELDILIEIIANGSYKRFSG